MVKARKMAKNWNSGSVSCSKLPVKLSHFVTSLFTVLTQISVFMRIKKNSRSKATLYEKWKYTIFEHNFS